MNQELFEPRQHFPNPFHPLDLVGCYALLDAMSEDELLEYGSIRWMPMQSSIRHSRSRGKYYACHYFDAMIFDSYAFRVSAVKAPHFVLKE